ncbi:MAG: hypothetical protein KKC75_04760 [Nanoarchaeota archaeon]|nr:hypothetical protein [Nanoarchaeota archaeon]MBU1004456.1 hypothetical protein [Nanoarchaeota archaeon]MBU1946794.1 hypothetical protein [Nanoarchaeota archaeon]
MNEESLLLENIKEFVKEGKEARLNKAYNSAVTLFFKALAVLCDLYILKKEGFIPKNHTERFEILKSKYSEIYKIMNKDFPVYQQSYRLKINKEYAEVLEKDVEKLIENTKINISD